MRADAQRNRDRIVSAAVSELTARGDSASMHHIAAAAGVSVGALYRHFPDRQDLLEHIGARALQELIDAGLLALADDDARGALTTLMYRCTELPLGLTHSLSDAPLRDARLAGLIEESNGILLALIDRAQNAGQLRDDLSAEQILAVISTTVCRPGARADDPLVTIVIDGLTPPPALAVAESPTAGRRSRD